MSVRDFDGSDAELSSLNQLDTLMCNELREPGKPELPAYGRRWLEKHCAPDRATYLDWHTLTLEIEGKARGFCIFSRATMATPSCGRRKRKQREAYMELFWIGLDPDHRGGGHGTHLLERSIETARERWPDVVAVRLHVCCP